MWDGLIATIRRKYKESFPLVEQSAGESPTGGSDHNEVDFDGDVVQRVADDTVWNPSNVLEAEGIFR